MKTEKLFHILTVIRKCNCQCIWGELKWYRNSLLLSFDISFSEYKYTAAPF